MSKELARAMLKEIPLGQLEVYLQILDSGLLKDRTPEREDNGTICGGGCDAKGGACGIHCLFNGPIPYGCFDQFGQTDLTKEHLHAAIKDPAAFRKILGEELARVTQGVTLAKGSLAPTINAKVWINRP